MTYRQFEYLTCDVIVGLGPLNLANPIYKAVLKWLQAVGWIEEVEQVLGRLQLALIVFAIRSLCHDILFPVIRFHDKIPYQTEFFTYSVASSYCITRRFCCPAWISKPDVCTRVLKPFTTPHSCTNPVPSKCWKFMITRLDRPLKRSRTSKMLLPSALQPTL